MLKFISQAQSYYKNGAIDFYKYMTNVLFPVSRSSKNSKYFLERYIKQETVEKGGAAGAWLARLLSSGLWLRS